MKKERMTRFIKTEDAGRKWYIVDAKGKNLGRLSTQIAKLLRGKNKVQFTPHVDCGDYVVVINAGAIKVTGNKPESKLYYRHSGYVGHLKSTNFKEMIELIAAHINRIQKHEAA